MTLRLSMSNLQIVSPFAHLSGHYWPYTLDIVRALSAADDSLQIRIHASQKPLIADEIGQTVTTWKSCAPWIRHVVSNSYRNRNWGNRLDQLLRNLEFYSCLHSAINQSRKIGGGSHIHCIESCHRLLLRSVTQNPNQNFSTLCVGSPPVEMEPAKAATYRNAFETKRLTFIVETEAVRADWEPYAGKQVVHIPAAIPSNDHRTVPQQEARKHLNLPTDEFICLFFGTHREGKDYRTAIEAAKKSESKPFLLFVGPLISGNNPRELLRNLDYPKAASWEGFYPDEKIGELFDACDAVMLPYAQGYDKGSAVLLQACQYLKPVIATDTGHLADFVNNHQTGILFEPNDATSLASCYDQMQEQKHRSSDPFRESIRETHGYYGWPNLSSRYLGIIRNR